MDLRTIRYFLSVLDEGSFRAAGRRLGVSQPAISHGVALLEEELGVKLLERGAGRVALTHEGRLFETPARRVLADFDGLGAHLHRERGVVRGRLEVGTTDAASIHVLPPVYRRLRRRHPGVELSVRIEGTGALLDQVDRGLIELAVVNMSVGSRTADVPESIVSTPLFRENLQVVVSRRHRLAARRRVRLDELRDESVLTFKRDSITRRAIDGLFREADVPFRVAMEISSPEAIKKLVEVGLGISVLPARSVRPETRAGALVALPVTGANLVRVLGVVHRTSPLSPAAGAFLELLETIRNVPA